MSIQHDKSGRQSIQVEVEVPGTVEEVWKAVATGPGVSSWFLPNTTEEWVGGLIVWDMGPGLEMNVVATVTVWDPPHRFVNLEKDWRPGAPPMTSEWTVEARPSGTCVVRVAHSVFADADEWDKDLDEIESNWPCCFAVLRSYMTHFRGQPASIIRITSPATGSLDDAWSAACNALGIADISEGERFRSPDGTPPLAGIRERAPEGPLPYAILRLDDPGPGIGSVTVFPFENQVLASVGIYLYGDDAPAIAARDDPAWQEWMKERFQ